MMRRIVQLLLLAFAAGLLLAGWSVLIEPGRLVVRHVLFQTEQWPETHPPLRVAVLSDLHVGAPHVGLEKLREIVATTNAERPDLVLLLGDYVIQDVLGGRYVPPEAIVDVLTGLKAPLGIVAVLGNHDWWDDGPKIAEMMSDIGIRVLENDAVRLDLGNGRGLWIGGLADDTTRRPDIPRTLARIDDGEPVLMLSHDPAPFAAMPERPLLTLAGHTHGGQVYLPWIGALIVPGRAPRRWAYGHIVENGRHLMVTGGIGTSTLPIRFNMPPEILVLEIGRESG
ncbi:metallophosphoesterase [Azospirillum soli]|uniref:metallophosphoesterase n=1 Tax=Azospirillum soli TaxID=1304799 RepID=UPI001AE8BFC7|nr:metallophosphoesterase [Azospirillum soli]MBP2315221.1 putative MPP superfamily phosphohydrolase [Azospirillum soli]